MKNKTSKTESINEKVTKLKYKRICLDCWVKDIEIATDNAIFTLSISLLYHKLSKQYVVKCNIRNTQVHIEKAFYYSTRVNIVSKITKIENNLVNEKVKNALSTINEYINKG